MGNAERRKNPRVQIFDPISYLSRDSDGGMIQQNVAVVRNVSQTGIQIESFLEIKSKKLSLMFFDLHKNQIEVEGKVVYCKRNGSGQFSDGLRRRKPSICQSACKILPLSERKIPAGHLPRPSELAKSSIYQTVVRELEFKSA